MKIALTVLNGPQMGRVIDIAHGSCVVLGRGGESDIKLCIDDAYISLQHVVIDTTTSCRLIDLGGTNPTHVNGAAVKQKILNQEDVIELGFTKLQVSIPFEARCFFCNALVPTRKSSRQPDDLDHSCSYVCSQHIPGDGQSQSRMFRNYQVCKPLGEGGMGMVYLVYDPERSSLFALKCVKDLSNTGLVQRFLLEMQELLAFQHPNIIRFVDFDVGEDGAPFLVTEYANSGDLWTLVKKHGPLEPEFAVEIFVSVLDGLDYIHSRGAIHRDIKPQNILLRRPNHESDKVLPKIADLGLVKSLLRAGGQRITRPGEAYGSWEYMPPEQVTKFSSLAYNADIYALGATLYFGLAGCCVIQTSDDAAEQLQLVLSGRRIPIRERVPELSVALAKVVDRACSVDPLGRFQSAHDFRTQLLEAIR